MTDMMVPSLSIRWGSFGVIDSEPTVDFNELASHSLQGVQRFSKDKVPGEAYGTRLAVLRHRNPSVSALSGAIAFAGPR